MDEPLSVEVFNPDGAFDQAYTYHADHLGSIRFITDSVGEIVNAYDYDSYGRTGFTFESVDQPFRYTGREFDQATELYHYRARQYDPETGKFLQEDPIGFAAGDLNIYRYVGNNPISYTDPSGLTPASETGAQSAKSAGLVVPVGQVGIRVQCLFATAFAALELASNPDLNAVDIGVSGFGLALECGLKLPKKTPDICPAGKAGSKCFAAGTKVHTRDGLKNIEDIVVGDFVKSMDPLTGEVAYKEVLEVHVNKFDPTGVVTFVDDVDGTETVLSVTAEHPFFHSERGWVHASKLVKGDLVLEDDRGSVRVTNVVFNNSSPITKTYNLKIADFHTYFVGEDGVLVHNGFGPQQFSRIQAAADAIGVPIHLVGSKAAGTDGPFSDFDFVIEECINRKQKKKAKFLLPKGDKSQINRGIDIFFEPLNRDFPFITFFPGAKR